MEMGSVGRMLVSTHRGLGWHRVISRHAGIRWSKPTIPAPRRWAREGPKPRSRLLRQSERCFVTISVNSIFEKLLPPVLNESNEKGTANQNFR